MTLSYNMSMSDYLATQGVQSSRLKHILHSPADYLAAANAPFKESPAQALGTAIHCAILEPEEFDKRYAMQNVDFGAKNKGDGYKRWNEFKSLHTDKIVLGYDDSRRINDIRKVKENHRGLKLILSSGHPEVTCINEYDDVTLKARTDFLGLDGILWDVKSTSEPLDDYSLLRTVKKFGYHFQAAHHMKTFRDFTSVNGFGWIFVSTAYPAVHIVCKRAPESLIAEGMRDHGEAMDRLLECQNSGEWPSDFDDDITTLQGV